MSSISASANSDTPSTFRMRLRAEPSELLLPPSFSDSLSLDVEPCSAGTSPNRIPLTSEIDKVNNKTVVSILASCNRGISSGLNAISKSTPHIASSKPSAQPSEASKTLSVSNCRINRPRDAPNARRMAILSHDVAALTSLN